MNKENCKLVRLGKKLGKLYLFFNYTLFINKVKDNIRNIIKIKFKKKSKIKYINSSLYVPVSLNIKKVNLRLKRVIKKIVYFNNQTVRSKFINYIDFIRNNQFSLLCMSITLQMDCYIEKLRKKSLKLNLDYIGHLDMVDFFIKFSRCINKFTDKHLDSFVSDEKFMKLLDNLKVMNTSNNTTCDNVFKRKRIIRKSLILLSNILLELINSNGDILTSIDGPLFVLTNLSTLILISLNDSLISASGSLFGLNKLSIKKITRLQIRIFLRNRKLRKLQLIEKVKARKTQIHLIIKGKYDRINQQKM